MMPGRSPAKPSRLALLEQVRDAIDRQCAEEAAGVRSTSHYDALEQSAQAMALDLVAIYRNNRP